jgi:hypothetical protein
MRAYKHIEALSGRFLVKSLILHALNLKKKPAIIDLYAIQKCTRLYGHNLNEALVVMGGGYDNDDDDDDDDN